ncbi:MAG: transglutaminase domain-containing protein [bacterium]
MKLWVNNIEHYRHKHLENFSFNNVSVPVELQKGWNRVLVKTTNKRGLWKFGMFITDPHGDKIPGISFSTEKKSSIPEIKEKLIKNNFEKSEMPDEGRELFLSHIKTLLLGDNYNSKEKIIKYTDKTENTLSLFYAAEAYNRAHLEGTYINTLNRAIKKTDGKLSSFITKKASCEMKKNLLDESQATIQTALNINPESFEARRKLLSIFEMRDWPVEQHRVLKEMHRMYPGDLSILRLLAYNYEYRGYYEKAVSFFRLMEKIIPGETSALNYLYRYHRNRQEYKKAVEYMNIIIRKDPDNPSHYLEKGTLLREMKKPEKAFNFFRKSYKINQQWYLPLLKTAELHHEMGREKKALEYWQKAFRLNPENSRIAERIDYMTKKDSKDKATDFIPDYSKITQKIKESSEIKIDNNANVLMIYDHAVTILNPDGSSRWEITMVKKALNEEGRDHMIHTYLPYSGRIKVKNAYAISPDGIRKEASSIRNSEIRFRKLKTEDITVIQYTHYRPSLSFLQNSFTASWYVQGSYYHTFLSEWKLLFEEQTLNLANRSESIKISESKSGKYKVKTFRAKDVPPLPREPYSPPLDDFIEKIVVSTISSWKDFTSWERALLNDAFMSNTKIKKLAEKLTSGAENKHEAIDNIFHFVAQEIRYQQDYATYIAGVKPHSAPRVLERGYGDCKDKSVLFIQLAAEAGIDVDYVLIRTTTSGKILKEIPNQQFNHAIVYIPEQEGIEKGFFMDPTVDLLEKGNLRRDNQGATALVLNWRTGGFHFKKVPYQKAELNFQKIKASYTISEDNTVSISGVLTTRGRISSSLRRAFRTEGRGRKIFESMISRIFKGSTLESYKTSDIEDITKPLQIEFKADASHLATKLDNEYHYRIPHKILSGKTISLKKRTLPLELGIHSLYSINTEIIIPDNFSISRMPDSYKTEHSCIDISRKVSLENNRINIFEGYRQTCSLVNTEDYPSFRKTVQKVLTHTGDKLILEKE